MEKVKLDFNSEGYYPKDLVFDSEARDLLVSGIKKISAAVKSTLGPRGQTVLIESPSHTRGVVVTKDGVTVAKSIDLIDPVENLAVRLIKEAADKTATQAGDGTSSSIALAEAIVLAGVDYISPDINKTKVLRHISEMVDVTVDYIRQNAIPIASDKTLLRSVATISANNDPVIGSLIADVFSKVGENGSVSVSKSQTHETFSEFTEGIRIERGATSHVFFNDQRKGQWTAKNAHVLVCDMELSNVMALSEVFKPFIQDTSKSLLIIAPVSQNFLNTIAANVVRNGLKICIIQPPSFGYRSHELMEDIAVATGAKLYSEKTGTDVTMMTINDLGTVDSVIVGEYHTILSLPAQSDAITRRVYELKAKSEEVSDKDQKEFLAERIASLTGGLGAIFVGGKTDIEQKELYDRVDDAVCAVKSAIAEGITVGGGKALWNGANNLFETYNGLSGTDPEKDIALAIMVEAMKTPLKVILDNAGLTDKYYEMMVRVGSVLDNPTTGIDAKNDSVIELISGGIVDPVKVVRCALENAASVATTILSTNGVITMARE